MRSWSSEQTVAQRIVRAKRTLASEKIPFEVPPQAERAARLASVLEVIYLIFNEGYAATAGDDWMRPALCQEALRLGRILAGLAPAEPEVHGLVALMEIQASRLRARTGPAGEPIPILEQNRGRWDQLLIRRGFASLPRCEELGQPPGPYVVQAAIAACHARAASAGQTDWAAIAALYELLARLTPSPVVELNRAVAVGMAFGPDRGLEMVDALSDEPRCATITCCPACAAICWPGWAAAPRPARNSPARPRWPRTRPSARSCCNAPPPAPADRPAAGGPAAEAVRAGHSRRPELSVPPRIVGQGRELVTPSRVIEAIPRGRDGCAGYVIIRVARGSTTSTTCRT